MPAAARVLLLAGSLTPCQISTLTGCDVSDVALEIASQTPIRGRRFVVGSIVDLPFPDRSFDVVGCFEVLEHLPGDLPRRALSELARVARRAVVLSVPHEPVFCLANAARGKNLDVRPKGKRPGPQAVLVTIGVRRIGRRAVRRAKAGRIVSLDDLRCHGADR